MNWINRNANEHQNWLSEKDKMEKQMRNQAVTSTNELIRAQLDEKERMKGFEKQIYQ